MIDQTHHCRQVLPGSKCLGKEVRVNNRQEVFDGLSFLPLAEGEQDSWTCYSSNRGEWQELAVDGTHPPTFVQISMVQFFLAPAAIQLCLIGRQTREHSTHDGYCLNRKNMDRGFDSHQKGIDTEASKGKARKG